MSIIKSPSTTMVGCLTSLSLVVTSLASSHRSTSLPEQINQAAAICRGTVAGLESFRRDGDGAVSTRALIRVGEAFKGTFPTTLQVVHRGGVVGREGELNGFAPRFKVGEERLLFLARRSDRTLYAVSGVASAILLQQAEAADAATEKLVLSPDQTWLLNRIRELQQAQADPGEDVTDQGALLPRSGAREAWLAASRAPVYGATNLLVDGNGISARFQQADRGEPIPYLVDADFLPAGLTLAQALGAVENALAAWSSVTSLTFEFEGVQSFGMAAANVTTSDGRLRIQLHDQYGLIPAGTTLGVGGRGVSIAPPSAANWASGGNVAGSEFNETTRGYVVLKHTASSMETLSTFEEVVCHEIGHALSMAHSSEDPDETNPLFLEALMYFLAHGDGRGASFGAWDPPVIQQVHPPTDTPPFTFARVMDITTDTPNQPDIPGINEIELRGYDLQTPAGLSPAVTNVSSDNGTFSLNGTTLKYTASGFFQVDRLDPADSFFFDRVEFRFSDGVNASAPVLVRVLSFNSDTYPSPNGDGIPDNWMITYFGNANPNVGSKRRANQDFDGDGFTNQEEFQLGSDPTDANSNLRITQITATNLVWQAKAYELYEVLASTNLTSWTQFGVPPLPTTQTGTFTKIASPGGSSRFFQILKVP